MACTTTDPSPTLDATRLTEPRADIADREDPRRVVANTALAAWVVNVIDAGSNEALLIEAEAAAEPIGVGNRTDHHEQAADLLGHRVSVGYRPK